MPAADLPPERALAGRIAVALVVTAAVVLAVVRDFDSDLFWHVAAGERVLAAGRVELGDLYSWTARGEPFVNHEWLAGVALALLARAGGFELVVALKALLCGLLWWLLASAARDRGAGAMATAWALLWALVLARFRLLAKPEVLSLVLVVVFDRLSEAWLRRGARAALVALVLLSALWANLHLLVVLGFAVVGAHAVGAWLGRRRGVDPVDAAGAGSPLALLVTLAVAVVATFANPYGIQLYDPVLAIYRTPAIVATGVREWAPPALADFGPFFVLAPVATLCLLASARRLRPQDALLWLGMLVMAGRSLRHIGAFAVVAAPVLARHLDLLAEGVRPSWRRPLPALALLALTTAAVSARLLSPHASFLHQDQSRFFRFGLGIAPSSVPAHTVEVALGAGVEGPVFNSWELGGYLIWRGWPKLLVFLDGRHYVYEKHLAWLQARGARPALAELDIGVALVAWRDQGWLEAFRADGRYHAVAFDDAALLLVRDDRLPSLGRLEPYRALRPEELGSAGPETLAETERAVREAPGAVRAWLLRGAALRRSGRLEEAITAYRRAIELDPAQASAWNNLGGALWQAGHAREAGEAFAEALRLDPGVEEARANLDRLGAATR